MRDPFPPDAAVIDPRPRRLGRAAALALLAGAAALLVAGCQTSAVAPERDSAWARAELVPTYTALPAPSATLTALPSSTPTARYATPTPDAFQRAGVPVRLEIPAIGVDATVEKVGRDAEGKVDVPKISANVAWFDESALPGQGGKTSVISGHLDDPFGPAVFYELRRLVPGDELAVTYSSGERFVFAVDDKERYSTDAVPSQRIFGTTLCVCGPVLASRKKSRIASRPFRSIAALPKYSMV